MKPLTLIQPSRIVIGDGCARGAAELFAARGVRRVWLATSKSVRPQIQFLVDALENSGCAVIAGEPVPPEPTLRFAEKCLADARAANVEAVLGVGGGSALDVAKLVAALAGRRQNIADVLNGGALPERDLFLVCLPTTAGTGSEVSPIAVVLDEAANLKKGVVSPQLVPDAACIDPQLTLAVPPAVTAASGLDALAHCIEAFANKFAHPVTDQLALRGVTLITENLLRAVRDGRDAAARGALALGSFYGGLCLGPVGTAAVHALAYPLGGEFRVAHGVANAVLLPPVLKFNLSAAPERYAQIAVAAGAPPGGSALETAQAGIERIARLSRDCGVPQRLSDLNIPRAALPALAKSALQVQRLLKNNLRPVAEADAARIYEEIF